jgi:hypothetical protein
MRQVDTALAPDQKWAPHCAAHSPPAVGTSAGILCLQRVNFSLKLEGDISRAVHKLLVSHRRLPSTPSCNNNWCTSGICDKQARALLSAPGGDSVKAKRDRAVPATLAYHGMRREELCRLKVRDLQRRGG